MRASLLPTSEKSTLAMLWDESHLWGLMLWRSLKKLNFPCRLLRSSDVAEGLLAKVDPGALLVPGGWARHKATSLGGAGKRAIKDYVAQGGNYIGFCGGAGLALSTGSEPGNLGLCSWGRKPMASRLVNCSGHLRLRLEPGAGPGVHESLVAPVWWPSQFHSVPDDSVKVLARYVRPEEDFWVADLPLQHLDAEELPSLEGSYGINLDPALLGNEPCAIRGRFGKGAYILSYAHLETPDSFEANAWLSHILTRLVEPDGGSASLTKVSKWDLANPCLQWDDPVLEHGWRCLQAILASGRAHSQIHWRNSWLLGWRRGIPGFALNTLLAQLYQIRSSVPSPGAEHLLRVKAPWLHESLKTFQDNFVAFLEGELEYGQGASSPMFCASSSQQVLRERLVGPFPGQSGLYGQLAAVLDQLLWKLEGPDLT